MFKNERKTGRLMMAACAASVIVLSCGLTQAAATKTDKVATYSVKNDNDAAAKGYAVFVDVAAKNIDLTKTTGKILTKVRTSERFGMGNPPPLIGTLIVFEDEKGIPKGKSDDIQITFKDLPKTKADVKFSKVSTLRNSTGADGKVMEEEVPRIGFKVEKDPIYTIINDNVDPFSIDPNNPTPVPITIRDIQYLSNVSQVSDTTPFLDFNNSYGFTPLGLGSFTVPGASESGPIDIPGPVDFGNWFYVRGIMTITHRNGVGDLVTDDIPFVHGQTEYLTPEPATLGSAAIGLLGWYLYRRRKRSSS